MPMFGAWKKARSNSKVSIPAPQALTGKEDNLQPQSNSNPEVLCTSPSVSLAFESLSVTDTLSRSTKPADSPIAQIGEDIQTSEEEIIILDLEPVQATSPVHRLPHDILSIIFILHVRQNEQSPWLLMHINQAWRDSALSTRPIWARIEVVPVAWKTSGYPRSRGGRENCVTYEQLQRAVARANGTALDLRFNCEPPSSYSVHKEGLNEWNRLISCFHHLSDQINVESLAIIGPSFLWYKPFIAKLNASKLQVLRLLHIEEDAFGHWAETATKLRVLQLGMPALLYTNQKQIWWKNLEELIFTNESRGITSEQYEQIRVILKWTTSLRILEFNRCSPTLPSNEPLSSPVLQELHLREQHGSPVVVAPRLKSLILYNASFCRDKEYMSLTHLEVVASRALDSEPLHRIFAPFLHTLLFSGKNAAENALKTWWPPGGGERLLNPIVLRFHNMRIPPSDFANALSFMTQLEELYFELVDMTIPLIDSLEVHCPHLQVVSIIIIEKEGMDIRSLAWLIRHMLRVRARANKPPLREAKIRIVDSDEWLDLL